MLHYATLISLAAVSGAALAQPAIIIEVDDPVLLRGESTTVTMSASYGGIDYAVAGIETRMLNVGGTWSDLVLLSPMDGAGTFPGVVSGTGVDGIAAGQINFHSTYADPTNPIAFWQATYTAPADAAAPFVVDLSTMTSRYDVYLERSSSQSVSRLGELIEGSATITIIPAPASVLTLGGGMLAPRRRR